MLRVSLLCGLMQCPGHCNTGLQTVGNKLSCRALSPVSAVPGLTLWINQWHPDTEPGFPSKGASRTEKTTHSSLKYPVRYFPTRNISQLFVRLWACQHHTPQKFKIRLLALRLCRGQSHVQSISDVPGQDEALLCVQGNIWCHTRQCCCHQVDFDVMMPCHSGDRDTDIITQLELKIFSFEWIATIQWKEMSPSCGNSINIITNRVDSRAQTLLAPW